LRRVSKQPAAVDPSIKILPYEDRFARAFKQLNLEWLEGYDLLEPADLVHLDDPRTSILDLGGEIFVAVRSEHPVGTCAFAPHGPGAFEIVKLAVTASARGTRIGRRLAVLAIEPARARGGKSIVLVSNSRLVAAIRLYESLGFRYVPLPADNTYATADTSMELVLE
jgi:ribosomal protein S18 acetylase RimI-like enzyme